VDCTSVMKSARVMRLSDGSSFGPCLDAPFSRKVTPGSTLIVSSSDGTSCCSSLMKSLCRDIRINPDKPSQERPTAYGCWAVWSYRLLPLITVLVKGGTI
jgi:hypothetical protein